MGIKSLYRSRYKCLSAMIAVTSLSACGGFKASGGLNSASLGSRQCKAVVSGLSTSPTRNLKFEHQSDKKVDISAVEKARETSARGLDTGLGKVSSQSLVAPVLKVGTKLNILIDNACATTRARGELSRDAIAQNQRLDLKHQAYALELAQSMPLDELESLSQSDPCVVSVTDQKIFKTSVYNDPGVAAQTHLGVIKHAAGANRAFTTQNMNLDVIVAIVDTGIDYNHPDLRDNMWTDPQGKFGYDFSDLDNDPMDQSGHGTHVAGLAGARGNNATGGIGVMPTNVKLMAVRSLGAGGGSVTDVVNGINYAVEKGAHVINLSLGTGGRDAAVLRALQNAVANGVVVVAAAGNDNKEIKDTATDFVIPGGYGGRIEGMITVASIDTASSKRSTFSNYSTTFVEIAAPGAKNSEIAMPIGLYSTWLNDGYDLVGGTSMSSPIVAGAAALAVGILRSRGKDYTPAEVEQLLRASSSPRANLMAFVKGGYLLDIDQLSSQSVSFAGGSSIPELPPCP